MRPLRAQPPDGAAPHAAHHHFSYALATERRAQLLFKGTDFTHTDVIDAHA